MRDAVSMMETERQVMRKINVAEDIVPMAELTAHPAKLLRQVNATGRSVVVTEKGKATAVIVSPELFEELGYQELVRAKIKAGLADADAERTSPLGTVEKRLRARIRKARAAR